jgi:hypothetical protein
MAKLVEVTFKGVESARRLQNAEDARRDIVRHTFDVQAGNIAVDVLVTLDGPNPRTPNIHKKAAKRLKESLAGVDPTTVGAFHLAHSGIRGIVKSFRKLDDTTYKAAFEVDTGTKSEDHGIANGLHTVAVIQEALKDGEIPPEQYVTFTLVENVPRDLVPYIGEGLNTNIQVAEESIIDLGGAFDLFKHELSKTSYAREIGWHENEPGEYDARDMFAILNALNVIRYPNAEKERHPIESYEKQSACIAAFGLEQKAKNNGKPSSFEAMIPVLKDALFLYDTIRSDAGERYKEAVPNGRPGALAIMEARHGKDGVAKPDVWTFPFISAEKQPPVRGTYRLAKGVTFAMLAAFRNFVRYDEQDHRMEWLGGFETVLGAWHQVGGDMMIAASDVSQAVNYNPNAVGKNRPLWRQLHQMVAGYRLEQEAFELRRELEAMKTGAKS